MTRRRRTRPLALLLVLGMLALTQCAAPPAPRPTPNRDDPSSANAPSTSFPPADTATEGEARVVPWGDGSYLDGHRYLRGVNIYSLIFAGRVDDLASLGEPQSSYDYLASRGVDIVRLAVPWQRLQEIPAGGDAADGLAQPVSDAYLEVVAEQVRRAAAADIRTIVDLHNGCTYPWGAGDFVEGSLRCGAGITEEHVTTVWERLAARFVGNEAVAAFDIFNEPRWSVGIDAYKRFARTAVDAIRGTGARQTIWVEGILSDTRGRLAAIAPDGPWVLDPLGRIMYSEHFYDNESAEVHDAQAERGTVLVRLKAFGDWCRRWSVRCAVGEVGWPSGGPGGAQSAASADGWNELFEEFYDLADEYELDATYFAASSVTTAGTLLAYVSSVPGSPLVGIDTALSQTVVIEAHPSR